jgi:uncharacterized membrane protein YdbT with pleckstrin-like domain
MNDFGRMISDDAVVWKGAPDRSYYVLSATPTTLMGAIWLILPVLSAIRHFERGGTSELYLAALSILAPFFLIGIFAMLWPVFRLLEHGNVQYAITESRIVIQGGLFVRRINTVPIENIRTLEVAAGFLGRFQGVGAVKISAGEVEDARSRRYVFRGIRNPEQVAMTIEKLRTARKERGR